MNYSFNAYGHENILSSHQNTLEFTKDEDLTLKGNCIVGVKADFELDKLRGFVKKIKIKIKVGDLQEEVTAEVNPGFNDDKEMVIRRSDFVDKRTFAINADKSSFDLDRNLVDKLKDKNIKVSVEIIEE